MHMHTMGETLSALQLSEGAWDVLGKEMVPMVHPAWPGPSENSGEDAYENYAHVIVSFVQAAISGLVLEDTRLGSYKYSGDAEFLEKYSRGFERVFLRSYSLEKVGFTCTLVHLRKA
jgi:hypothetical protein